LDEIIIDEGQDFRPAGPTTCCASCAPMAAPGGWKTPAEPLRPPALPGWVTLRSDTNYRSPRDILATLRLLLPLAEPVMAGSP
jgi:hypothetical protein